MNGYNNLSNIGLLTGGLAGRIAISDYQALSNAEKGYLGENAAELTLKRAGYTKLASKLKSNTGFDGVYVKYDHLKNPLDIIIVESKTSQTGKANLRDTVWMGRQGSDRWIGSNIKKMMRSDNLEISNNGEFLYKNQDLIRFKANVLDSAGI